MYLKQRTSCCLLQRNYHQDEDDEDKDTDDSSDGEMDDGTGLPFWEKERQDKVQVLKDFCRSDEGDLDDDKEDDDDEDVGDDDDDDDENEESGSEEETEDESEAGEDKLRSMSSSSEAGFCSTRTDTQGARKKLKSR